MRWTVGLPVPVALVACGKDGPLEPPDISSPLIQVVFPVDSLHFDRDGDGLIDLEIRVADSSSGFDPATLRITSDRPVKGSARSTNLVEAWRIEKADGSEWILEEIPEALLPRGKPR